jgi:hypothetical protein
MLEKHTSEFEITATHGTSHSCIIQVDDYRDTVDVIDSMAVNVDMFSRVEHMSGDGNGGRVGDVFSLAA